MNLQNHQRMPKGRYFKDMVSVHEYIIFFGAMDRNSAQASNDFWTYNSISGVWKRYQPPIELGNICNNPKMCVVGNKVYICGMKYSDNGYPFISSLVSFDFINATWETLYYYAEDHDNNSLPQMDVSLFFCHKKCLYVVRDRVNHNKPFVIYKFSMRTSTWSLVQQIGSTPKCKREICGTVFKNHHIPQPNLDE
ncbi:hypothetical protein RF11_13428 [Thelohanellus kitauei]|uniref:Kelch domain-containing protein 10 n=1 Tax=Thelohanellus kitauei TaxID=669202 RepID=A0A0C2I6T6_THEKT|nr:hypothetical protein RF11_13428 [Thelohanellus kitauei]